MFLSLASDAIPPLSFYIYSGKLKERHLYPLNYLPKSISLLYRIILHRPYILQLLCVLETLQHNRKQITSIKKTCIEAKEWIAAFWKSLLKATPNNKILRSNLYRGTLGDQFSPQVSL